MTALQRFLGPEARPNNPFTLLGLTPERITDAAVIAALEQQLDRIDQHPQGDTPEAEEARLALHAAAAQLLDPLVRRHLIHRLRPDLPLENGDAPPAAPHPAQTPIASAAVVRLEQDAILTLARFGGINPHSMRRLAALAQARGLDPAHAAEALQHLARRRPLNVDRPASPTPGTGETAPASASPHLSPETAEVLARARRTRAWQAAAVAALLLLSLVSLGVLLAILAARAPNAPRVADAGQTPEPTPPAARPSEEPDEAQPPKPPSRPARPLLTTAPEILELFTEARAQLDEEPEAAIEDFAHAVRSLAAHWPSFSDGQRRAAHHAVLEFLYTAAPWPTVRDAAFDLIARPAARLADGDPALEQDEVAPAVWSVGMLARLADERELSVKTTADVRQALIRALGTSRPPSQTFEDGARAASAQIPLAILRTDRLSNDADAAAAAIETWTRIVIALSPERSARERALADGLERILIEAADPSTDPRALAAVRTLVAAIPLSPEGPARARLLDWFRHPRITSDDMAEVTAALTAAAVEGLDSTMVLSRTAGRDDRLEMARAYAQAWQMERAALADETAQRLIETAHAALAEQSDSADAVDPLQRALRFARLNEIARRIWRGERSGLAPLLDALADPAQSSSANLLITTNKYNETALGHDGQWALRYREARRNIPVRLELLAELERAGSAIGPVDAEVLAEEAFFGTPTDRIRPRAQDIVVQFSHDPAMILAVLEVLPRRRTILPGMARMVASVAGDRLGSPEDPQWMFKARRALVRRALDGLAPESQYARIDPLVATLSKSYRLRAGTGVAGGAAPVRPSIAAEQLIVAARDLWDVVNLEADALAAHDETDLSRDAIQRRRRGRRTLARGPTQIFAAEQISIAELLAWTVAGEQRSRAADVQTVVEDMNVRRQSASRIYQQIEAAERAMLALWLIRFGEEVAP